MITIRNFGYRVSGPVAEGQTVRVRNTDSVAHTVTADAGNAFGVTVPASGTAAFTAPRRAGSYRFHCAYHANMHGTLVVHP
jgi:plastocyanin